MVSIAVLRQSNHCQKTKNFSLYTALPLDQLWASNTLTTPQSSTFLFTSPANFEHASNRLGTEESIMEPSTSCPILSLPNEPLLMIMEYEPSATSGFARTCRRTRALYLNYNRSILKNLLGRWPTDIKQLYQPLFLSSIKGNWLLTREEIDSILLLSVSPQCVNLLWIPFITANAIHTLAHLSTEAKLWADGLFSRIHVSTCARLGPGLAPPYTAPSRVVSVLNTIVFTALLGACSSPTGCTLV